MALKEELKARASKSSDEGGRIVAKYEQELEREMAIGCYLLNELQNAADQKKLGIFVETNTEIASKTGPEKYTVQEDDLKKFCKRFDLTLQTTVLGYMIVYP